MTRNSIPLPPRADPPRCNRLSRRSPLPRRSRLPQSSRVSRGRCWGERLVVLGPIGLAITATVSGMGEELLAPLWLAALAWTVLASLALALDAGFRHGDWSAFRNYDHEPDREEELDLDLRTGGYAWMRDVLADGSPRNLADGHQHHH